MSEETLWKSIDRRRHCLVAPVLGGLALFAFVTIIMFAVGLAVGRLDSLFIQISLGVAIVSGISWALRGVTLWLTGPVRVGVDGQLISIEHRKGVETVAFETIRRLTVDETEGGRTAIETMQGSQVEIGPGGGLGGDVGSLVFEACLDWIRRMHGKEAAIERKRRVFWFERTVRFQTGHLPSVDGY